MHNRTGLKVLAVSFAMLVLLAVSTPAVAL
jgi:hypothetical protein